MDEIEEEEEEEEEEDDEEEEEEKKNARHCYPNLSFSVIGKQCVTDAFLKARLTKRESKRYGWTFLDIFYPKTKTVAPNNVLDNKPTVVAPKVPEPAAKPAATTVTVTLKPTNKPTPATPASVTSPTPQKPSSLPTQQPTATIPEVPAPLAKPSPQLPTPVTPVSAPVLPVASTTPANTPTTPLAPFAPKKSNPFLENGDASLKDALDKKLMQTSDTVETVKNDLKNATANFLTGESSAPSPTKNIIKSSKSR
uniref:Uncharacterized protein n=1 Tax=Glossina austeni TaxID=7395 RepID=A0A1A9VEA6_GLOAU